jgi:hypothetical protein
LRTVCSGWPQIIILPVSASQVARIIGVIHQCLQVQPKNVTRVYKWRTWEEISFNSDEVYVCVCVCVCVGVCVCVCV